jgi:hypothetical protein
VTPVQLLAAMVSTTAPFELNSASKSFDTLTIESLSNRSELNAPIAEELA